MMVQTLKVPSYLLIASLLLTPSSRLTAGFTFTESATVEFSTDNETPTEFGSAMVGSNTVMGSVGNLDADIFSFIIPDGFRLDDIILTSYSTSGSSIRMFAAMGSGPTFQYSVDEINSPAQPDLTPIMGAGLVGARFFDNQGDFFGTGVGDDLLTFLGGPSRLGGTGFPTPLPAGTYTVYLQETGSLSNYGFSINVSAVPEPNCAGLMGLLCVCSGLVRRRPLVCK